MSVLVIKSIEDIEKISDEWDGNFELLSIEGSLSKLTIKVSGDSYDASFPSSFAASLVELQNNFYKAVAFALYGKDDKRSLTRDDLAKYELVFSVNSGCTEFNAKISEFIKNFCSEAFKNMTPKDKKQLLIYLMLILAAGWIVNTNFGQFGKYQTEKIKTEQQLKIEQERTKQIEILSGRPKEIVEKFSYYTEESTKALVKGANGADYIKIGESNYFDKSDIEHVNQRASKGETSAAIETDQFKVFNIGTKDSDVTRFSLSSRKLGEITAIMDKSNFDKDDIDAIWESAKNETFITLDVSITRVGNDIKSASIISVTATK